MRGIMNMKKLLLLACRLSLLVLSVVMLTHINAARGYADESPEYLETIRKRADKIVARLELGNETQQLLVRDLVADQYRWLNRIHSELETEIAALKSSHETSADTQQQTAELQAKAEMKIARRHAEFLKSLDEQLTPSQVDAVKDGMTYGVVQVTFSAYERMLPDLTDAQRDYIMQQLVEAREHAMDLGSSDAKHKWFGKYKGRINNYLSKAGYDLKTASKRLEKQ